MARDQRERLPSSIGELYKKITLTGRDFEIGENEGRLVKEQHHPYVKLCKRLYSFSRGSGKGAKFTEGNQRAINFLNWKLTAAELTGATSTVTILALIFAFITGTIVLFGFSKLLGGLAGGNQMYGLLYAYAPFLLIGIGGVYYFQLYPTIAAKQEQTKALTYVPEIMGYMVMSIKLVPNLERAVEFAASHGKGKIAKDFKDLIWNVQIGVYNSVSEGLDELAYRWGKYSEEFKRALMRVRASVIENSEAKRYAMLDQTMTEMLESIKNKMEQYARNLSQPSTMLFYLGVLLPLLLIIILPVGSSFSGAPLANPIILFLIYNVAIPLMALVFAYNLIHNRPPTYEPPVIPDNYPGLPKKWHGKIGGITMDVRAAAIAVFVIGMLATLFISAEGIPPKSLYESLGLRDKDPQIIPADKSAEETLIAAGFEATYFSVDPAQPGRLYTQTLAVQLRNVENDEERQAAIDRAVIQVKSKEQLFFSQGEHDITPTS